MGTVILGSLLSVNNTDDIPDFVLPNEIAANKAWANTEAYRALDTYYPPSMRGTDRYWWQNRAPFQSLQPGIRYTTDGWELPNTSSTVRVIGPGVKKSDIVIPKQCYRNFFHWITWMDPTYATGYNGDILVDAQVTHWRDSRNINAEVWLAASVDITSSDLSSDLGTGCAGLFCYGIRKIPGEYIIGPEDDDHRSRTLFARDQFSLPTGLRDVHGLDASNPSFGIVVRFIDNNLTDSTKTTALTSATADWVEIHGVQWSVTVDMLSRSVSAGIV